ncbi:MULTISPECIES: response regulator transcription factor [unclassified Bacillus (in: firmicutes)]|uniref:response regulator transcription factor n=1 Tax=unclassified Bacillus (in: firmicutes) TaxID=185979 RepID=UPI0008EA1145|nr:MULTISPECIES: response regulator transcription factor [unclassified Bacillus (in: firmicutes)]SFJ54138.1 DNA-binding response regulator, OmpR family, contains REC and winged-helix (wHTH) domain [Bacillus sp. 71mf]SFT19058.1 DNA-binding response regulator, OmpR family, contains REC and winged-helix (wHTH) domain [Bacillus sp. 103mf]
MENKSILLVDDEKAIVKMIEMVLRKEGFSHIYTAHTATDALAILEKNSIDMIVLDVMLPDYSGFELCPKIRAISNAYILFLTAKVSDLDVLTGFAIGGDDYVTKPFNPLEIAARIKAHFRRTSSVEISRILNKKKQYNFGRFLIDEDKGELFVNGQPVSCPTQVYLLLLYLCKHPNKVFSKSELLEAVWGFTHYVDDNTVSVHVRRIRERIEEDPSQPQFLLTVRGLGYKLVEGK